MDFQAVEDSGRVSTVAAGSGSREPSSFPQILLNRRERARGAVGEGQRKVTGATAPGHQWGPGARFVACL